RPSSISADEGMLDVSFNVGPDHPLKNVVLQSMSQKMERLLQEIAKREVDRGFSLYQANRSAMFRGMR
ncbi:MAG TPA: hypothetical protein VMF30_03750, partial [Pirellulales bacterium]|nr:hypothetical protein [Pirellulales bacterium]